MKRKQYKNINQPERLRKRKFLALKIILLLIILLLFAWRFNLDCLKINRIKLNDARIKDKVSIVLITDLHGKSFGDENKRLVKKVLAQEADAVLVAGDMYTRNDLFGQKTAARLMHDLAEGSAPVFYVTGEHDNDQDFHDLISSYGVKVLAFDRELLQIGNTTIELYGINSVYFWEKYNLANEVTADPSYYSILLAHIPNWPKYKDAAFDLILSGDTHGGQVRLPFLGAVWLNQWLPEIRDKDYLVKGLYSRYGQQLIVSSGLGTVYPHLRFWNRPEIVVIELEPPSYTLYD